MATDYTFSFGGHIIASTSPATIDGWLVEKIGDGWGPQPKIRTYKEKVLEPGYFVDKDARLPGKTFEVELNVEVKTAVVRNNVNNQVKALTDADFFDISCEYVDFDGSTVKKVLKNCFLIDDFFDQQTGTSRQINFLVLTGEYQKEVYRNGTLIGTER